MLKKEESIRSISSLYDMPSLDMYTEMKLPFLNETEKITLNKKYLDLVKKDLEYRSIKLESVNILLEGLTSYDSADVRSPVMNLKFYENDRIIDFSNESFVKNFFWV